MAGLWKVILPTAATNDISNPSFETNTTGWAAQGTNTIAKSNEQAFKGAYSAKLTYQNDTLFVAYSLTLVASQAYHVHGWIYVPSDWDGGNIRLRADSSYTGVTNTYNQIWTAGTDPTEEWFRIETKIVLSADNTGSILLEMTSSPTAGRYVYLDAAMVEQNSTSATTYCDGDQDGCEWTGAEHASKSSRSAQIRAGGQAVDLEDYNFRIRQFDGIGMPPIEHQTVEQALLDGAIYQGSKVLSRYFLFTGSVFSTASGADFHSKRKSIVDAVKPNRVKGAQPVLFRYSGANDNKDIEIAAVYDRGLDFSADFPKQERVAMRLVAHDPYFYEIGDSYHHLTLSKSEADADFIIAQVDGDWTDLATGLANTVYALAINRDRDIYSGGVFTTDGAGNTLAKVGRWNGTTWNQLDVGLNGDVHALLVAPNGDVYAGGSFTDLAGGAGTPYQRIARFDGTNWNAMGTGAADNIVYDIAIDTTGNIYIVGSFTGVGGVANTDRIAKWDGSSWSAVGTGIDNGTAEAIAIAPNGDIYVGGSFTTVSGSAISRIAKWNGSSWGAVGGAPDSTVYALAATPDGHIFAGGAFTDIAGTSFNRIAVWNGGAWSALGTGLDNTVYSLYYRDGVLYVGGQFTEAGGVDVAGRVARWNGFTWGHLPFDPPGTPIVYAYIFDGDDTYIGYSTSGTATTSYLNTVTNSGTANAYPKIILERDGGTSAVVEYIKNETTGSTIWLNYSLQDGERITLDFTPRKRKISSTYYGDVTNRAMLRPSDFAHFYLLPGDNDISVFVKQAGAPTMVAYMLWRSPHLSVDGVAS